MNNKSKSTASRAGNFTSEDAARRALGRRRTPPATPTDHVNGVAAGEASPATRSAPLRRWSVAELIARAVAFPAAIGIRR